MNTPDAHPPASASQNAPSPEIEKLGKDDWPAAIDMLLPFLVKIETPRGSGTGFVISSAKSASLFGIATAAHVVNQAHFWEEPIRITHKLSGRSFVVRHHERAILLEDGRDTAAVIVENGEGFLPQQTLPLPPQDKALRLGNEVGWLGFPAVSPNNLCFFTGRTSCWIEAEGAYLIDGVAINGVSGGPVFHLGRFAPVIIGVISAYIANRTGGEALPGLSVAREVKQFYDVIRRLESIDEAKSKEAEPKAPPTEPPQPGG